MFRETERVITTGGSQFTAKRFRHKHSVFFFKLSRELLGEEKRAAEQRCERGERETGEEGNE